MSDTDPAIVGRKACGCVVAAVVDSFDHRADVSRTIAGWRRSGLTLERMTVAEVRPLIKRCPHVRRPEPAGQGQLFTGIEATS